MFIRRRALTLLGSLLAAVGLLTACAAPAPRDWSPKPPPPLSLTQAPPIVFVHGNGDSAALWQTTLWRFESNGWPADRLHAINMPYPLARDDDTKDQPGRTSTAEHMAFLKAEVEKHLKATGAEKVILIGNSRGGYAIRNYIQNGGGAPTVSHAVLGGVPNHGVWSIPGDREGSEFSGTGPFLKGLNAPKNAAGDEVTGPVRWLTIRSDKNDKFAQPDGQWIGRKGQPTGVTYDGPALKGAINIAIAKLDHRETSFSAPAFDITHNIVTGRAPQTAKSLTHIVPQDRPVLRGLVTGLGLNPLDPATGDYANNLPLPGATLAIYAVDPATGERVGGAAYQTTVGADGQWGPFTADNATHYEFVVAAPGYATTHIYRSPFARSSAIVHLRPERIAAADKAAGAIVSFTRPRGYFDPDRDNMQFDGQAKLPGVLPGAGVATSKLKLDAAAPRAVVGQFNDERVVGRVWPAADGHTTVLELTY